MRTFTNIFTINGSFGDNQDRYTVKTSAVHGAGPAMHLLAWHAARLGSLFAGLKSLVKGSVTEAVHQQQLCCCLMRPPLYRQILCRQPMRRSFGFLES